MLAVICSVSPDRDQPVSVLPARFLAIQREPFDWETRKQAVFLTAKTTAMVCWLFVGSALFSGVFAILGKRWSSNGCCR